jgi:hypothetical protein
MIPYGPYVMAYHLQDLLEEAALERRAKLARRAEDDAVAPWRRGLGSILASAARVVDPCLELASAARRSADGSTARTFAA